MKSKHLWPVAGYYLSGVPHVEHDCDGEGMHHICDISGAFTETPPEEPAPEPTGPAEEAGSPFEDS